MKNRHLISAEYAIKECFRHVKMPVLEEVIGKSDGFIYKCSDPDEPHQLSVRDALLMDRAVYIETKGTVAPFSDLFDRNIARVAVERSTSANLQDSALSMQTELGEVSAMIRKARDISSDGGAKFTPNEISKIISELEDLQRALTETFITAQKGNADAG